MRDRRSWVRADGKRPVQIDGSPASSTDPDTWFSFAEVRRSGAGDGFGVMLGDGLACFDFDDASDEFVRAYMADKGLRVVFAERSMSGRGSHVFVEAPEGKGWRRRGVEFYSRARFIRVTGEKFIL